VLGSLISLHNEHHVQTYKVQTKHNSSGLHGRPMQLGSVNSHTNCKRILLIS
jgi:hypothetical protein